MISGAELEKNEGRPTPRHLTLHSDKALDITRAADSPNGTSTSVSGKAETFGFDFDHVFGPEVGQEAVFDEVSQLVQSAIDGYNVCIFAYGQVVFTFLTRISFIIPRSPFFYYVFYTNVFPGFVHFRLIQTLDSTPYILHSVFHTSWTMSFLLVAKIV